MGESCIDFVDDTWSSFGEEVSLQSSEKLHRGAFFKQMVIPFTGHNQIKNLKASENARNYLGRYSQEFNLFPVASQLDLLTRIAGANFSTNFSTGAGAGLVIAHAMNKRFASGLQRFLQPKDMIKILDKALTDPAYMVKVMEATNTPLNPINKAKNLRPTLLEAGIDIAEKDLIEEIENNPDLMNNEEYQNLWNAYLKEMRRKK